MKRTLAEVVLALAVAASLVVALPVTQNKKEDKGKDPSSTPGPADVEAALEYERYLREVVEALEADPEFRKKLDKAPEADIRVSFVVNDSCLCNYPHYEIISYYLEWKNCTRTGLCESSCTHKARRDKTTGVGAFA